MRAMSCRVSRETSTSRSVDHPDDPTFAAATGGHSFGLDHCAAGAAAPLRYQGSTAAYRPGQARMCEGGMRAPGPPRGDRERHDLQRSCSHSHISSKESPQTVIAVEPSTLTMSVAGWIKLSAGGRRGMPLGHHARIWWLGAVLCSSHARCGIFVVGARAVGFLRIGDVLGRACWRSA